METTQRAREDHDLVGISHSAAGTPESEISPASPMVSGSPSDEPIFSKLEMGNHALRGA
jgi:hypothetical protein